MKFIKLNAYLRLNAGDDLMVEQLLKRYPNYKFYCWEPEQKKTKLMEKQNFFTVDDVYSSKILGRLNRLADILTFNKRRGFFFRWIFSLIEKRCCNAVYIGGSLFREKPGGDISKRIIEEKKRQTLDNRLYIVGANFGPYNDEAFFSAYHDYFKTCSGVSFRDSYSYNLFHDIVHVSWAPDVVLTIDDRKTSENNNVIISVLGFKLRPHLADHQQNYIAFISDLCKYSIENNKTPILTSFCEYEGDSETIDCILKTFDESVRSKVETYIYRGDTDELLEMFASCSFVVATRFHSMILGIKFNKKMFTVSYECKTKNVLDDINDVSRCNIEDVSKFSPSRVFELGAREVSCEDYINSAQMQFSQLDAALN